MTTSRIIMALDLGSITGLAVGAPGARPRSGVATLKDPEDNGDRAVRNLGCLLRDEFSFARPDIVVYCGSIPTPEQRRRDPAWTAEFVWQLVGAVHSICGVYGVRAILVNLQDARKHFVGRDPQRHKVRTIIGRAHDLNLMPRNRREAALADAISLWDFACQTHCGTSFAAEHPMPPVMEAAE